MAIVVSEASAPLEGDSYMYEIVVVRVLQPQISITRLITLDYVLRKGTQSNG